MIRRKPYRVAKFEEYHDFEFPMTDLYTLRLTYIAGNHTWYGTLCAADGPHEPHEPVNEASHRDPFALAAILLAGGVRNA
jgi:hypothetical protein